MTYCVDDNILDPDPLRDGVIRSEHLQIAFELPSRHEARTIMANACAASFLMRGTRVGGWGPPMRFKFEKELATIDGFANELVQAIQRSVRVNPLQGSLNATIIDPLTGKLLNI
jgi:hypothetical protein